MITSKKDLYQYLSEDFKYYKSFGKARELNKLITNDQQYQVHKFITFLRKEELYFNKRKNIFYRLVYLYYCRKKNNLGNKLGFYIFANVFDKGLTIFHHGSIVVNGNSKVGKNCKLHGENCIGNNGFTEKCPVIGDNVDIGIGAKVIGDVYIADDIVIGANSVVTKSFYEKGVTIAGIPARVIKKREEVGVQ